MPDEEPALSRVARVWVRRAPLPEVALVLAAAMAQVGTTALAAYHDGGLSELNLLGVGLLAAGVAALPFRHRFPAGALVVSFAATLAYWSLDYGPGPIFVSLIVAFAHALLTGHRRAALAAVVAGYAAFPWLGFVIGRKDRPGIAFLVVLAAWLITLVAVTEVVRSHRDRAREAARSQAETVRRQATEERLRIARELHDVVAHHMSLIHLQAGAALHRTRHRPHPSNEALFVIKEASKQALVELRSIVGVLRHVDEDAPRAPTSGLDQVADLVARSESAGVRVHLDTSGPLGDLPRNVDLAAYRILQEALTNVARHSNHPDTTVRVRRHTDALTIDVLDEGTAPPPRDPLPAGGNGIAGMKERAASVGGHLHAGPRLAGGFGVHARLPIEPAEAPT
jgi:signal transduction histidine kinase